MSDTMPDSIYIILLLIAPTLLVWRWDWAGVWLGALTLWLEIIVLMFIEQRFANMDIADYRMLAVTGLLSLLYCLFVISCKSWYATLRAKR